ncbi:MAG: GGDEF domain-containing response regulator, partial [Rhodospirillales bacterium]
EQKPDLILLDVMMPEMDGFEVLVRLKDDPATSSIPVIFVTALAQEEDEAKGLRLGAIDYVTKPLRPPVVRARVRNHLALKKALDDLSRIAATDPLTGLANRRAFDEAIGTEWARARRGQEPLSLVLLDLDHFKAFNDTYGHGKGDDCLRATSAVIDATASRASDLAVRLGGEEFGVLLPGVGEDGAMDIAERIRAGIEALAIPHAGSKVAAVVTSSLGVATCLPSPDCTALDLYEAADKALYSAKNGGRNRVGRAGAIG